MNCYQHIATKLDGVGGMRDGCEVNHWRDEMNVQLYSNHIENTIHGNFVVEFIIAFDFRFQCMMLKNMHVFE